MHLKPARPDLIVRDPVTGDPLPATGLTVTTNRPYWLRRLRDDDVIEVTAPKAKTKES